MCPAPPALPKQVSRNKKRDRQGQALKGEQEKNSDEFPKQVSRNKKRDRQGREKVPETVNKNKLQVTSYKLPDSL